MSYKKLILWLKPIEYNKYSQISSNEKLMLYAALKLTEKEIPLTFSYLCIATFKFFPEKFYFDEEFREYPAWEKLNRTYMHLKYTKWKQPYISWSITDWFFLTKYWRQQAEGVTETIDNWKITTTTTKKTINDSHKQGRWQYQLFIQSDWYKNFEEKWVYDEMNVWYFFKVTPYTQTPLIEKKLKTWLTYAKEDKDTKCIEYINKILSSI